MSPLDDLDCDGCPVATIGPDRRAFLRGAMLAVAGALASLGAADALAAQLPVSFTAALRAAGNTRSYAVPAADGVQIDKDAEVILVRWQNEAYAFNLSCPHQRTALRWNDAAHRFQCPKHKSQYQPSGEFISGRATRGMDRFAIRREGAALVVDLDAMHKQDADPAGWAAAAVRLA